MRVRKAHPRRRMQELIQVKDGVIVTDEFGNGTGAFMQPLRGSADRDVLHQQRRPRVRAPKLGSFDPLRRGSKMKMLYGDQKTYANKVAQSVDKMVKGRFLTESDGRS